MLVKTKKEEFQSYLEDTSNVKGNAQALYLPQGREEVDVIMDECARKKTPVTLSGGRTGTTGGCVPFEGVSLSLEGLNTISDYAEEKKTITVEAGVTLEALEREANRYGLTFRAAPTESLACVGGAIATSASGVRGFGYGSIRNYVMGLHLVLPSHDMIYIKRGDLYAHKRSFFLEINTQKKRITLPIHHIPHIKSQAGYFIKDDMDVIDLFIGSEGTLGIIVAAELSLQKKPFTIFDGLIFFKKEEDAFAFIHRIQKQKQLLHPAALEFFDERSLAMLKSEYSFIVPSEAAVYFEQEVENEKEYHILLEQWASLIEEAGASLDTSIIADTPAGRDELFSFRHRLPQMINEFLRSQKQIKAASDIAVPWFHFSKMYSFYKEMAKASGINYVNFGHIGEGHLHFNFLPLTEEESLRAKEYLELFCEKGVSLGGTVSAEHGIGKIKKPYLRLMYTEEELRQMALLKKQFDPHCLLGGDTLFDKKYVLGA